MMRFALFLLFSVALLVLRRDKKVKVFRKI